jgi:hypothetical protein
MNTEDNKEEFQFWNDEWNTNECKCHIPRGNSFTGNCLNCNKLIKPIKNDKPDGRRYKK